jgi:Ca-activated chloride channel family protein
MLSKEDFADDTKDAGEIGAGHTVTALYEIVPAEYDWDSGRENVDPFDVDNLKYIETMLSLTATESGEVVTVHVRYKEPDGDESKLITTVVKGGPVRVKKSSNAFRFSAAVAMYAMILRESAYIGNIGLDDVQDLAKGAIGDDEHMYRAEFIRQVQRTGLIIGLASK